MNTADNAFSYLSLSLVSYRINTVTLLSQINTDTLTVEQITPSESVKLLLTC